MTARRAAAAAVSLAATVVTAATVLAAAPGDGAGASGAYSVRSLHFLVHTGPGGATPCDIVGDVYVPRSARTTHRVPAVLTTNGFGGSAADQAPFARTYAADGYVVLSYSGLGFGGSGCKITLDDPDYDGVAAAQLVDYLGGKPGVAFLDAAHHQPAPVLDVVTHDAKDHHGVPRRYDPRVGMWGGSYGGQIQFAAAGVDARIDALNPQITWHDLSYSLAPNNSPGTRGVVKTTWAALFSTVGILDGVQYAQQDPSRVFGCPNFATFVCPALVSGGATGYLRNADVAKLRHASVATYLRRIRVPVLLDQGEVDTLFNLNEAVATYRALRAQGTPVAMMWRYNGHSGGTPSAAGAAYEAKRIKAWFDRYLKGRPVSTGPGFAYYRDWTGTVAEARSYPVGTGRTFYLSGNGALVSTTAAITPGTQAMATLPGGPPTTIDDPDALGGQLPAGTPIDAPDRNVPGSFVSWSSSTLRSALTVVGAPALSVRIDAPTTVPGAGPAGQLVLFAKVYDVAADGSAELINGLVAPVRVADPTKPVQVTLPAFVHRFATGHRLRLVIAGGDLNYRGGLDATPVYITTGTSTQRLSLPVTA